MCLVIQLCRSLASLASSNTDGTSTGGPPKEQQQTPQVGNAGSERAEKISKAMKAYLERAKSHGGWSFVIKTIYDNCCFKDF